MTEACLTPHRTSVGVGCFFERNGFNHRTRDLGINAFTIVGVAMEAGIEPTARHGVDLGYIPIIVTDACGTGHEDAARRSIASLEFAGDSLMTNVETICGLFRRMKHTA
jgi:nicotinamidase-related amidase